MLKNFIPVPFIIAGIYPMTLILTGVVWGGWVVIWPLLFLGVQGISLFYLFRTIIKKNVDWIDLHTWAWTSGAWILYFLYIAIIAHQAEENGGWVAISPWLEYVTYTAGISSIVIFVYSAKKIMTQPVSGADAVR